MITQLLSFAGLLAQDPFVGTVLGAVQSLTQEPTQTVLQKLDPDRRAAVILALIGLGILGALLVCLTMLAGRWARQGRRRRVVAPSNSFSAHNSDSSEIPTPSDFLPEVNQGETLVDRIDKNDTRA